MSSNSILNEYVESLTLPISLEEQERVLRTLQYFADHLPPLKKQTKAGRKSKRLEHVSMVSDVLSYMEDEGVTRSAACKKVVSERMCAEHGKDWADDVKRLDNAEAEEETLYRKSSELFNQIKASHDMTRWSFLDTPGMAERIMELNRPITERVDELLESYEKGR